MIVGSLCSGYEGIGLGIGGTLAYVCDPEPAAARLLAADWPGVPNHHDLKALTWADTPVDVLTAGYPCQPFSHAGKRRGTDDPRHLWPYIADGIARSRPPLCLFENVRGHLNLGFDTVLLDLHRLGYDVRWTLIRAADVGAPHGRARLFIVAADRDVHGWAPSSRMPERVAGPGGWETADAGLFGAVPVTATPPPAGRMVDGVVWAEPALLGTALYDLLPTPRTSDTTGAGLHGDGGLDLRTAVTLLPTPRALDATGVRGRTENRTNAANARAGSTLADVTEHGDLLPTPRATDGTKGGPNQAGSSGDLMLPSAVMPHNLLPTPTARDWKGTGPSEVDRNSPSMAAIGDLLPTPAVNDMGRAYTPAEWDAWCDRQREKHGNGNCHGPSLHVDAARLAESLLPTPTAQDSAGSRNRTAYRANGGEGASISDTLTDIAWQYHGTHDPRMPQVRLAAEGDPNLWGRYAAAIARCETLTRPAPPPTEPTGRGGAPRLSPAFVEWMMMLPAGHVTGHGLTRNEELKLLGNGVVPAQAAAAWQHLTADLTRRSAAA